MLNFYMKALQSRIRDREQRYIEPEDARAFINKARREIAMRTQCIRRVPPTSGAIQTITVTAGGSGYTNPTVTISLPDSPSGKAGTPAGSQATALAQTIGGVISNISVTYGGDGYFQPVVTITDPTGHGAAATANVPGINILNAFQEEYAFADFPLSTFPGVDSVFAVLSVSSIFSNLRYTWVYKSFSEYQAFIRTYPRQYYYTPAVFTQFEQGNAGTLLVYPIPSQPYQFEPDCLCLPSDLEDESSFEAIPEPWTDAVAMRATSSAFEELQNFNAARYWQDKADSYVTRYSAWARAERSRNWYGRG
jgi:hypothetical protein